MYVLSFVYIEHEIQVIVLVGMVNSLRGDTFQQYYKTSSPETEHFHQKIWSGGQCSDMMTSTVLVRSSQI